MNKLYEVINVLANGLELDSKYLNHKLVDDKRYKECSEDDYNEALFVYIESIRESLGSLLERIDYDYYE